MSSTKRSRARSGGAIGPKPNRFIGGPTRIVLERIVEGEVPDAEFPTLVEEIRLVLQNPGQVQQLGRSFSWNGSRGSRHRDAEVAVTVRGGRTRIIVQESLGNLIGGVFGGIGGGMGGGGVGPVIAILTNTLQVPEAATPLLIPLWLGVTFAVARTSYYYSARRRVQDLETLADRLAALARDLAEPRGALPAPSPKRLEP